MSTLPSSAPVEIQPRSPSPLVPGNLLPNGARILRIILSDTNGGIVLAKREDRSEEYVTWGISPNLDPRSTFNGRYFSDKAEALADFYVRAARV